MWRKKALIFVLLVGFVLSGGAAIADCPSADLTGDCFVNFEDLAIIGAQWLNEYDWNDVNMLSNQWLTGNPNIPDDMVYIPDGNFVMGDHFSPEGGSDELPLHDVLLDAFFMSKYEITNSQYCDYLNDVNSLGLIEVRSGVVYASPGGTDPYCDTHSYDPHSQIDYNDVTGTFSVREKDSRDMSDDPMVEVSWYGAVAYCNWRSSEEGYENCYNLSTWECDFSKQGYRLATEAEWEYAARGGLSGKRFPWSDLNITYIQANYYAYPGVYPYDISPTSGYPPLWNGVYPYTSPVGFFDGAMKYKVDYNWPGSATSYQTTSGANGYGLYDMAGNAWEWCNDWRSNTYYSTTPYPHVNPTGPASGSSRVIRGGGWDDDAGYCRVASRRAGGCPDLRYRTRGFRIVLDF